jgi:predicted TPR repeat methyltransferase
MEDGVRAIVERRPSAVLDAGIGFGLWGALLRQYLDVWSGRILPADWTTRIDGMELDERRVLPHARHLYTEILVGDIRELVPCRAERQRYDVILFGDVIEHLPLLRQSVRPGHAGGPPAGASHPRQPPPGRGGAADQAARTAVGTAGQP